MIIIAGARHVEPAERARYLTATTDVTRLARQAPGYLDFSQAPDELDAGRINVYERWESDEHLHAFRTSGGPDIELPPLLSAEVRKYRISAVEEP